MGEVGRTIDIEGNAGKIGIVQDDAGLAGGTGRGLMRQEAVVAEAQNPYAVLRNGDFVRYLIGRLVAVLGQQMLTVAVGWELYERTGSALALGLVGLTEMTAMVLLTLPAGHLADN